MTKNPPYEFKDGVMLINGKPFNQYILVSDGQWFIKGSEVRLECHIDGIINVMCGWIIKDYQVRQDEETCGIDEFIFIDRETKEEYMFDSEPLGIFKGT
jgi:hypothetical protein